MATDPTPTPPASPDRIAEAIAKLGGPEKARETISERLRDGSVTDGGHPVGKAIYNLALSALDAPAPAPDGKALLRELRAWLLGDGASAHDDEVVAEIDRLLASQPEPATPYTEAEKGLLSQAVAEPAAAPAPDARDDEARIAEAVRAFGDAQFNCGEWRLGDEGNYDTLSNFADQQEDALKSLMREFAARPKAVTRHTVTQTGEHFCETQCKERVARAPEIADLRQKLEDAERRLGHLDSHAHFDAQVVAAALEGKTLAGSELVNARQGKFTEGNAQTLLLATRYADLRQKLAAAEREAEPYGPLRDYLSTTLGPDGQHALMHSGHAATAALVWLRMYADKLAAAEADRNAVAVLRDAALWVLGEAGNFRVRADGDGPYWWRAEFRQRCGNALRTPQPTPAAEDENAKLRRERDACRAALSEWREAFAMPDEPNSEAITRVVRNLTPAAEEPAAAAPTLTAPSDRDWTEDAGDENGSYECKCVACGSGFIGHKRRVVCRVCATPAAAAPDADAGDAVRIFHVQDGDRPMYVVARDWSAALDAWWAMVRAENEGADFGEMDGPDGISKVADSDEVLIVGRRELARKGAK